MTNPSLESVQTFRRIVSYVDQTLRMDKDYGFQAKEIPALGSSRIDCLLIRLRVYGRTHSMPLKP